MLMVVIAAYEYGATMIAAKTPPIKRVFAVEILNVLLPKIAKAITEIANTAARVILESIYVTAFASHPKADSATRPLKAEGVSSSLVFKNRVNIKTLESNPIPGNAHTCAIPPLKT